MSALPTRPRMPTQNKVLMEKLGFPNDGDFSNWRHQFELMLEFQDKIQTLETRVKYLESTLSKECG